MARTGQSLAIVFAIVASFIGYLYYLPDSENIPQINRVRLLSGTMRLVNLVSTVAETSGISDRVHIARGIANILKQLRTPEENEGLKITDTTIENVPVRIARPLTANKPLPAIIYFHGGAFYMGSVESHNALTNTLARLAGVVVISVDYGLAPEHPFPEGLEDCYRVTKYVLEHGDSAKVNIDRSRVAIAGDSAGGNFAAVLAMRFAEHPVGKYSPSLQILIYPVLQFFDFMLPSVMEPHIDVFRFSISHVVSLYLKRNIDPSIDSNNHTSIEQKRRYRRYVDWSLIPSKFRTTFKTPMMDNIEGDPTLIEHARDVLQPDISPLLVDDDKLAKLPPTYILSVGHDRLRDEAFIYSNRVKNAGVQVVHNHYDNTFHGSLGFLYGPFGLDIAKEMLQNLAKYVRENL